MPVIEQFSINLNTIMTVMTVMSQVLTASAPLWKPGRNSNVEFLSSFKRLQKEDPELYAKIEQRDGFTMQEGEYEYRTGTSRFGLWLSRRRMGLEGLRQLEDKPPQRPDLTPPSPSAPSDKLLENLTKAITELAYSVNTMVISSLANDEDSRARVLARIERKA